MQLNPARGRKHARALIKHKKYDEVYAAQPREGTETRNQTSHFTLLTKDRFMQLNPARGRKHLAHYFVVGAQDGKGFMQLNPARGRKQTRKFEEEIIIL